jgi:hypothetical protein
MTTDARSFLEQGRVLEIDAEKLRKKGDLVPAGRKIAKAAICFLKAICVVEKVPCESDADYFKAAAEIARRFRQQNINRQFGLAIILYLNTESSTTSSAGSMVNLSGDQIKTFFKDVQKLIHLVHARLRVAS